MLLKVEKKIPLYQSLGVFTEAPTRPKRKPKIINGSSPNSLSDYTSGVEAEEELDPNDMDMDGLEDGDTDDLTAGSDDEELQTDDPGADEPATGDEDLTAGADDDAPATDDSGTGGDAPATDEPVTDDGGGGDEPATDGGDDEGDDFTSGADDDGGDDGGGDDTDTSSDDSGDGKGKEFKKEDMKKFILFQNFMALHTSLENYISKLDTIDANNTVLGHAYREIKSKFQELQSLLYDYMLLKFSGDTYPSAFYFYEQTKAAILILFSLLEEAREKAKKADEKQNPRSKTQSMK